MAATILSYQVKNDGSTKSVGVWGKYANEFSDALKYGKVTHIAQTPPDSNGTVTVTIAVEH